MGHKLGNSDIVNILHATDDPTPVVNQVQAIYAASEPYLYFDGVDDYLKATTSSGLEFALPMKIDFLPELPLNAAYYLMEKFDSLSNNNEWALFGNQSPFNIEMAWRAGGVLYNNRRSPLTAGSRCTYELILEGADVVHYVDGVETARDINANLPTGNSLETYVGKTSSVSNRGYKGRIYSIQMGSEIFEMNEGSGSITTGSEGTVLSIVGATWGTGPNPFELLWENT